MSIGSAIKGTANFLVPIAGSQQRADAFLDAVAGDQKSLMRAGAGVLSGLAYGKVAYQVATDTIPESWNQAMANFGEGDNIEGVGGLLLDLAPEVAATGLLGANAVAHAVVGFTNSTISSSNQSA